MVLLWSILSQFHMNKAVIFTDLIICVHYHSFPQNFPLTTLLSFHFLLLFLFFFLSLFPSFSLLSFLSYFLSHFPFFVIGVFLSFLPSFIFLSFVSYFFRSFSLPSFLCHYPLKGNVSAAKSTNNDLDFDYMRVAAEVGDVLSRPIFDHDSVLLFNAGLHYLESTNFTSYQKTIDAVIRLVQDLRAASGIRSFPGSFIWKTSTALNKQKLDGKHMTSRRFLTFQVRITIRLSSFMPAVFWFWN